MVRAQKEVRMTTYVIPLPWTKPPCPCSSGWCVLVRGMWVDGVGDGAGSARLVEWVAPRTGAH